MICYPNAKINLGLKVLSKRPDGFHNIDSFFLPIPLYDVLEVQVCKSQRNATCIHYSGIKFPNLHHDLVIKVYNLLNNDFDLPGINIHLHKNIPFGSGLGGGSSDATFMLMMLNKLFDLELRQEQLLNYTQSLGSDCAFFLVNDFSHVSGLGEIVKPVVRVFKKYHIVVVKPDIHCSTSLIFSKHKLVTNDIASLHLDIKSDFWKKDLVNDLEEIVFTIYPELKYIKERLYSLGAKYVSMSGSGSSIYGLFEEAPNIVGEFDCWVWQGVV